MFLVNSRYRRFSATPFGSRREVFHLQGAHLLPKLQCHFAEFLNQGSLKRLGFSPCLPVSVYGTGYDDIRVRGFSWKHGSSQLTGDTDAPPHSFLRLLAKRLSLASPILPLYKVEPDIP